MIPPFNEWLEKKKQLEGFYFNSSDTMPFLEPGVMSFGTSNNLFMTSNDCKIEQCDMFSSAFLDYFYNGIHKKQKVSVLDRAVRDYDAVYIIKHMVDIKDFSYEQKDFKISLKTEFQANFEFPVKSFTVKIQFKTP